MQNLLTWWIWGSGRVNVLSSSKIWDSVSGQGQVMSCLIPPAIHDGRNRGLLWQNHHTSTTSEDRYLQRLQGTTHREQLLRTPTAVAVHIVDTHLHSKPAKESQCRLRDNHPIKEDKPTKQNSPVHSLWPQTVDIPCGMSLSEQTPIVSYPVCTSLF